MQQVAQRVADLEKERGKPAPLNNEREQQLIRRSEEAKLALQQKHEQTTRALVQQHEESKLAIVQQFEQTREDLEKRLAQAVEQLDQQRKSQLAATAEHEKLQSMHRLLTQELSIARGNVEELKAEIERLSTIQAQMQAEVAETRKTNSRMASQLDQERLMRAMMENTRSWQMTKPLRDVVGLFKPPPKG